MKRARADLRSRIIDSAMRLLRNGGMRSLAQPQVAKAAGIPQGHLTYYFPRRDDLLLAVAEHSIRLIAAALPKPGGDFGSVAGGLSGKKLRARVLRLVRAVLEDHERTRLLLGLLIESDDNAELRKKLIATTREAQATTAQFFGFDSLDDPDAQIAFAAMCGFAVLHFAGGGKGEWKSEPFLKRLALRMAKK